MLKQSATDAFKTFSKREIQKTAQESGGLIGHKTANKTTKLSKNSQQSNLEKVTNENDKKFLKKDIFLLLKDKQLFKI